MPVQLPDDTVESRLPAETVENVDFPDSASEVSKRLNLLGKLIVPPSPR